MGPPYRVGRPTYSYRVHTNMIRGYFKSLYRRAVDEAYQAAYTAIGDALASGGTCLDCGAHEGQKFKTLESRFGTKPEEYRGVEWHADSVLVARANNLDVVEGDLNRGIDFPDESFRCLFALSVLEHLLNPCRFLRETKRCLEPGGTLVLVTPNISTYFTAVLILLGRMPSSGPHPDSESLVAAEEVLRVQHESLKMDSEADTPVHRHLVVFSYVVLKKYLKMLGFEDVRGRAFGLYPFPNFVQPVLERIDPYHCHQMVFTARKPGDSGR